MRWTADDIPELEGRVIIVTGANSGIGVETARQLARRGATVVLACRRARRAEGAVLRIREALPLAKLVVMQLDLADLDSVRAFAAAFAERFERLDVLCNNAGVMAIPRRLTADGFEAQFGTNHLGHFALTGQLLEPLRATPGARVVTVSSQAHRMGRMRFDDLQGERFYQRWLAYAQSKLANLLFCHELERRAKASGSALLSVACHPGYADTNLQLLGPTLDASRWRQALMRLGNRMLAQSAAMGALPTLYAALSPDVQGADYIGPDGLRHMWGYPVRHPSSRRSRDEATAARLWQVSEELTGVEYAFR